MTKKLLCIGALLIFPVVSQARQRVWGFCQKGGVTITIAGPGSFTATPQVIGSYPACTVTVFATGTTSPPVAIYSDNNGTSKANPFLADPLTGYWFFYVDNGRYDVRFSGTGFASPSTNADIIAFDSIIPATFITINGVAYSDPTPGDDMCATISAAIAASPSTGAVLDATGFIGTQSCATPGVVFPSSKPIKLRLGDGLTLTVTATIGFDLNESDVIEGAGPGQNLFPSNATSRVSAGATNVTLFRVNGSSATPITGVVLRDFQMNGGSFSGTKALVGTWASNILVENVRALNFGSDFFTCAACFESKWLWDSAESGTGTSRGFYFTDNASNGNANLLMLSPIARNLGGAAVQIEGAGGGMRIINLNSQGNAGPCLLIQNASDNLAPNGIVIDSPTCESNNPGGLGQIVAVGNAVNSVLNLKMDVPTLNGASGAATAIHLDYVGDSTIYNPLSFGHTNFINITPNSTKITVEYPRLTDVNFYKAASSLATVTANTGGGWQLGPDLANPVAKFTSVGSLVFEGSVAGRFLNLVGTPTGSRTQTLQDVDGDTFVYRNTTDTLTNKSLSNPVIVSSLPIYTTNANAVAGGLGVGRLYRNGADPDVVCVVH